MAVKAQSGLAKLRVADSVGIEELVTSRGTTCQMSPVGTTAPVEQGRQSRTGWGNIGAKAARQAPSA